MAGNVSECVSDTEREARGGAWNDGDAKHLRTDSRNRTGPEGERARLSGYGFRCAQDDKEETGR